MKKLSKRVHSKPVQNIKNNKKHMQETEHIKSSGSIPHRTTSTM